MLVTRENTPKRKSIPKPLNTSVATINKLINQDLYLKNLKKVLFSSFSQGMWFNVELFVELCMETIWQEINGNAY